MKKSEGEVPGQKKQKPRMVVSTGEVPGQKKRIFFSGAEDEAGPGERETRNASALELPRLVAPMGN